MFFQYQAFCNWLNFYEWSRTYPVTTTPDVNNEKELNDEFDKTMDEINRAHQKRIKKHLKNQRRKERMARLHELEEMSVRPRTKPFGTSWAHSAH